MGNKSNSLSRVERHQREKVLRFSIRKYSFGAASVAVAALMFLGARVASADSVIENNSQNTTDVVKQKEKDKSLAEIQQPTDNKVEAAQNPSEKEIATNIESVVKAVDKANLRKVVEELNATLSSKSNLDNSVISPIKDRVQKGQALLDSDTATQKDVNDLLSLLENDLTVLSNATKESSKVQETTTENKTEIRDNKTASELSEADKTISDKKESLKLSAEQLQAAVLELPEHESTKEVFEKANELLGLAQGVIQNTTISPNDIEDLTKRVKRTFNSVKIATLRLTSGKNDPRNGNKIEEGSHNRAASISPTWDSSDNLLIYQRHRASDGNRVVRNGLTEYTEKKVDLFAKTTTIGGNRYVVYDVFFNNDGRAMANQSYNQIYRLILPPQILDLNTGSRNFGTYKTDTMRDLKFDVYRRNGDTGTLSQNPEKFTKVDSQNFDFLRDSVSKGHLTYFNTLDIRHGASYDQDMRETFRGNSNDPLLAYGITRTDTRYNKYSYGIGIKTNDKDKAVHMHVKVKLRQGVTDEQVRDAFTLAVAGTYGLTTNQAYTFVSGRDTNEPTYTGYDDQPVQPTLREKQAKLYPIQGSTHTKVVGDVIPNTGNPVADKYVTRKGSGDFPAGMRWDWKNNSAPSTANAGKFTYTAVARYQDGSTSEDANSGSDGRVHFTVNPKKPVITASDVQHKKGLTNQRITVNVGTGVKTGSTVTLYSNGKVIGTGKTNGATATITVAEALPGTPITAITTVDNNGVVTSERSEGVTPTDAPDNQPPTVKMTNPTDGNKSTVLTDNESTSPVTRIYRGATLNVPLSMYDNDPKGKVNLKYEGGLPKGVTFNNGTTLSKTGAVEKNPGTTNVTGTVAADAPLGKHTATFKVSDDQSGNVDKGNKSTVKFRTEVVDLEFEDGKGEIKQDGTLVVKGNKGTSLNDANSYLRTTDGTTHNDSFFPGGMKFRFIQPDNTVKNNVTFNTPGKHVVKAAAYFPENYAGTNGIQTVPRTGVTGDNVSEITNRAYLTKNIEVQIKPTAPTVTPETNGDVTVTPVTEENVNTFNFTYNDPNNTPKTVTATKTGNGWTLTNAPADGVTIDQTTGKVTIKDRAIKDSIPVTAKSVTKDNVESDPSRANSNVGDNEPPKFKFTPNGKEKVVDATGRQVVYVTPTEETDLNIGAVTDNSGKLVQAIFRETNGNTSSGLGFPGLNHNGLPRTDNVEVDAPRNIIVTGKVSEYKTGTTPWADTDEFTRGMYARDAATNEIRNTPEHPTNVVFKVLTQATKYVPQVSAQPVNVDVNATSAKITQSDFDALKSNITFDSTRGPVKIDNTTTGLKISMKEDGAIKQNADGSHYVGATIEYPDHSIDEIQIPVVKADANEPSATMDGMLLTKDENTTANFVVFKGAKFTPTFNVRDDRNKITNLKVTGLPNGTEIEKTGSWTSGTNVMIEDAANTSTDTATLGDHVGSVEVTDSTGNKGTYKYKYKVVDVEVRNSPKTVELGTKLVDAANANNGQDSHNFVKVVDGQNNDGDDKYYPAGMNFKWSTNNAEITTTTEFNKPGVVTDYKALVKFSSGAGYYTKSIDGKTVKVYTPASIQKDVIFHVAPPKPTFNQDAVSSTTRTISGTLGGFTSDDRVVEVHLNDKDKTVLSSKDGQVTINGDTWTATLPDNVKLRQSENKNGETEKPLPITVVNKVGDTNVSKVSDPKVVTMGDYSPSATIAGSKHIDVTVPHDAKRIELRFHNSTDSDNTPNSIVLVRDENGGDWKVDPSTAPAGVTNANNFVEAITNSVNEANKAENKVSITLKETDNNKKLLIKEETASGDNTDNYTSGLGLRVDYKPETGQNATPAGKWQVITVTNDAPVVTLKDAAVGTQENPKVYTAGTPLTADLLKELVTVSDTEDDSTTDKPFGTGKVNVISGLPENPRAGVYTVTLQPVDSQGKAGNQVTVHVVVKEQKPAAPTIAQWQNGNVKVTPPTDGDKVTIPLTDGTVTLVKNGNDWQLETPKEGVVFRNGSLEIPKKLVGTSVTAKATKGTGGSAVESDDATYTTTPHKVTTVDVIKEVDSPLTNSDLSGKTGVTGVVDGTETKDFTAAKITSVVEKTSPLPNVTPDSKHTIPVTITYEDGSTETTDVIVKVKPQAPTVTPKENGTVEITPILTGEGTTTITYTGEDNTPQTVTVTKTGDGTWTSSDPTIAVDANGKVIIPADKVKDGSPVTAQVTSKTTDLTSQSSTETAGKPLTVEVGTPVDAIENKAYTSDKVVTPNKDNSTITPTPKNGLTVTPDGKVTGTPDVKDWGEIEENRTVTIKVTVTHEGDTPVEKDVVVNVLRDTDGDGTPDKDDLDDDNDGIPDDQDKNPKVADELTGTVTPPTPMKEKAEVPPVTVVTTNKPGATITTENPPVNELSVNGNGELTGTPTVDNWDKDEEERQINIPVKITKEKDGKTGKETEEIKVEVPVTILRDTDGDGIPDKEDADDDNDGIPDDEEKKNGTDPKVPTTQTPTIGITRKENGDAIVTPTKPGGGTYPPGTTVTIPGNDNTPIEVTIGNDGSGTVPNDKLPKTDKPGTGTVTEPNKAPSKPVEVTTPARKPSTIELEQDPKTGDVTVTPKKPDGSTYPPGTTVEIPGKNGTPIIVTIEEGGKGKVLNNDLPEDKTPGTGKITENGKDPEDVKVETPKRIDPTLPETDAPTEIAITRKENGDAIVTPKKPGGGTYPPGTKVEIPGEDGKTIEVTIGNDGSGTVPNDSLPKDAKPGTGTVTEPNKKPSQPVNVTTPARKTPTVELEQNPNTGDVTVTPKKPGGGTYPPGTIVEIPGKDGNPIRVEIGQNGKGTVPNSELPDGKTSGNAKITEPNKPVENVTVETPARKTPTVELQQDPDTGEVTVTPKKPDGSPYPSGTKVEIPGKNGTPIVVTIGEDGKGKVPNKDLPDGNISGPGTITEPGTGKTPEKVTVETPARLTPALVLDQDPNTGDVTVTPKKPDGTIYPPGTKVEIPGKDGTPIVVTTGPDGKVIIPNKDLPDGEIPGTGKITPPGKPSVELEVKTPKKLDPNEPQTEKPEKPGGIEITRKPNGDAIVTPKKPDGTTYPPGTKVVIPGDHNTPIEVTIGDNGSGEVPNDKLPKGDLPGKGIVTEPNKRPSQPVDVTTPARKTPTVELEQEPSTGDVTVTPKRPDGSIYPPGTKVEIPGKNGTPIVVTIGEDGKGKVPNKDLPEGDVPGTGKIIEPGKPDENVNVTTPSRKTPTVELEQDPDSGDVTVTPKKPDGGTYPPGTKVEIPGKNGNTITVTIGEDGKGKVPNSELPDGKVPGKAKITEPGKPTEEVPVVTTPARKTPTVELEQDPSTGDVTVTPKRPDGSIYPPGTKVEIPGKNGNTITVIIGQDGKGKVPNNELPDGKVPGVAKITEPGKPTEEVPVVTTPAKLVPTVELGQDPKTGDVTVSPATNGDSGQDKPAPAPTTPIPDAVTPNADQVDTKTTIDNGAKSNDSQNVLPNTGTESNATLASLGLLGMLGGLGLALGKKKED
ncbi:YSIRK-type signal peptide-containing protein [uncultured Streptococcus sp.]|uniref:YSIRK-type signal peptide-containing protein n=1 Tax=uncultured Streptococcus sp. TaxID=83427 RepID=UPI0028D3C34F|nr:YSIRK-type signal peptide-containing protein [uncultured Streptococcus sp.]